MTILKWAGGKKQLLSELKAEMPSNISTYIEPFIGGGALFFDLKHPNSVINDSNRSLINMYESIKNTHTELLDKLDIISFEYNSCTSQSEYYYNKRDEFNRSLATDTYGLNEAALFIFINKTCFNGLYRVNKKGLFNVPWNKSKHFNVSKESINEASRLLSSTKIMCGDFVSCCSSEYLDDNTFIYFDPPYFDTFTSYTAEDFNKESQERLATLFYDLSSKNIKCMLSNSNTEFIKDLYKDYSIKEIEARRAINRSKDTELIIKNY